ncbi:hypothetical protein HRbin03_00185 [archaeon HR03]|nr:hypothetical protein HRbin03_00185 [archaeon HR03]
MLRASIFAVVSLLLPNMLESLWRAFSLTSPTKTSDTFLFSRRFLTAAWPVRPAPPKTAIRIPSHTWMLNAADPC